MANWEKLIEEHYSKKNKIDAKLIVEMIDLELENAMQAGSIEGHAGKRLSTKGTKKAGGDPYSEDPPKKRSKSAPAGFGALEEDSLEEATIRASRLFYYVRPDKAPKSILGKLGDLPEGGLDDRLYVSQTLDGDNGTFTFFLADKVTRQDIADANRKKAPTSSMSSAKEIGEYTRKIAVAKTKITWLQTKPEELRAENEHLGIIKEKFLQAGITPETPATVEVLGQVFKNVGSIDKLSSKTAVGDFGLLDPEGNPLFTISHKAVGFERYAAMVSTIKGLGRKQKIAATRFIKQSESMWKRGVFAGSRSSKGYYQMLVDPSIASQVVYLIYGKGSNMADSLFVGEISLEKKGDGYELDVEPGSGHASFLRPQVPDVEEYLPIFRTRYGSGGSKVGFTADDVTNLNNVIQSGRLSLEDLDSMKVDYTVNELGGVENVSLPVRYYISPFSRNDGGEEIEFKPFEE